jgi:hypothetical protein
MYMWSPWAVVVTEEWNVNPRWTSACQQLLCRLLLAMMASLCRKWRLEALSMGMRPCLQLWRAHAVAANLLSGLRPEPAA